MSHKDKNKEEGVLYLGPLRVGIEIQFIGGLLCLTKSEGGMGSCTPMGYPNVVNGMAYVSHDIGYLSPFLQAAFRTPENLRKWSALMCVMGEIWEGELGYIWETNTVYSTLERLD